MKFYILSLKHSRGDFACWWRPDNAGYTDRLEDAGVYDESTVKADARYYNDGVDSRAIPVVDVDHRAIRKVPLKNLENI